MTFCLEGWLLNFISDIVDIKPANMEDLTEVITSAEFHPHHCHLFVYSSSKGTLRLCDMRASALCDRHAKRERLLQVSTAACSASVTHKRNVASSCRWSVFEEPEDPGSRSFFSEIISSVSDVKFSHSGRYLLTRDYLTAKVWDLNMDKGPVETYQVRQQNRAALCGAIHPAAPPEQGRRVSACSAGPRISEEQAVLALRKRLHL